MSIALQKELDALVHDVLGTDYVNYLGTRLSVEEDFIADRVRINCEIKNGDKLVIEGVGVGVVDALFSGLIQRISIDHPSLKSLMFVDFSVKSDVTTKTGLAGSDSKAHVELTVENNRNRRFTFSHSSRSVTHSSVAVTLQAISYFINSEKAFLKVRAALEHAKTENRYDSVERYKTMLAQLVENTSYDEAISKTKQE